jgi:hypothetical protein
MTMKTAIKDEMGKKVDSLFFKDYYWYAFQVLNLDISSTLTD